MAQTVSGKAFTDEAWAYAGGEPEVSFNNGAYPEAGEGAAALVDEESAGGGEYAFTAVVVAVELEQSDRRRPQRREPLSLPLAYNRNGSIGEIEPAVTRISGLMGARAGVVEKSQDGQITHSVRPGCLRLCEQCFQFLAVERPRRFGMDTFGRNGEDALGLPLDGRDMEGEILEEALDCGQAQIPALCAVAPAADRVLQVAQEGENGLCVEILYGQGLRASSFGAEIGEQELECVAVALDRIWADRPLVPKINVEEVP